MQRCTNKLYWLDQQAKDRMHYDWSDRNPDYPSRRRQYEVCVYPPRHTKPAYLASCLLARNITPKGGSSIAEGGEHCSGTQETCGF